jgi:branched-chain amino acid transport system substrate-binding protein
VGPDLTREKIADVLAHTSVNTDTYGGPITCTPEDHQCYKTVSWFGLNKSGGVELLGRTTVSR